MVKLKDLMKIERILLEIDTYFKFELPFGDAWELHNYLVKVGKITSYAFLIQDEFSQTFKDTDKLKEYHDKLMENSVQLKCFKDLVKFIEKLQKEINNEKLDKLISSLKWW
jgi:uncharacterized protein YjaZ